MKWSSSIAATTLALVACQPKALAQVSPSVNFTLPDSQIDCRVSANNSLSSRAQAIGVIATKIHNEPRQKVVTYPNGTQEAFPLNNGPAYRTTPGQELYLAELAKQSPVLAQYENVDANLIRNTTREMLATATQNGRSASYEDYAKVYESLEGTGKIPKPLSLNTSDEVFGAIRMGFLGYNLKLVTRDSSVYANDLANTTTKSLLKRVCGSETLESTCKDQKIFVSDFTGFRKYFDDKSTLDKYGVETRGYFCYNSGRKAFLPLAIKIVDTGLTYTSDDKPGEWEFAKMVHHAVELNYQQMRHLVEVHLVSIPMEVELMRTLSTAHPIYQLLKHHFFGNLALELAGGRILLDINVPYDKSLAFGARGSLRYLLDEFKNVDVRETVETDIGRRGLGSVPISRLAKYGLKYSAILNDFTQKYVAAYYGGDRQVAADCELQHWASNMQQVTEIRGFPTQFTTRTQLQRFVAHLIYQNAVKHHFMNGMTSWHMTAAPFRTPSLWNKTKSLPARKGVDVNPLDYAMPPDVVPDMSYMAARFYRPMPRDVTLLDMYKNSTIATQPKLQRAVEKLRSDLSDMEQFVVKEEAKMRVPMDLFRPSKLPYFSFI